MIRDSYLSVRQELEQRFKVLREADIGIAKDERRKATLIFLLSIVLDVVAFIALLLLDGADFISGVWMILYVLAIIACVILPPIFLIKYIKTLHNIKVDMKASIAADRSTCQNEFNQRVFFDYVNRFLLHNGFRPLGTEMTVNEPDEDAVRSLNFRNAVYQGQMYSYAMMHTNTIMRKGYPFVEMQMVKHLDDETDIMIFRRNYSEMDLNELCGDKNRWDSLGGVNIDNSAFAGLFDIRSPSEFHTFKLMTPALMGKILELDSRYPIIYLSFSKDRATICFQHPFPTFLANQKGFDVDAAMRIAEEQANVLISLMQNISFLGRKTNE